MSIQYFEDYGVLIYELCNDPWVGSEQSAHKVIAALGKGDSYSVDPVADIIRRYRTGREKHGLEKTTTELLKHFGIAIRHDPSYPTINKTTTWGLGL